MDPILVCANGKTFKVWTNHSCSELSRIGPLVRFTADSKTENVYVWDFNSGHHADVSIGLKLDDPFNSLEFLRGHAERRNNGTYQMIGSDFLQSFVGHLVGKDKVFLTNLLNQQWNWLDDYNRLLIGLIHLGRAYSFDHYRSAWPPSPLIPSLLQF